MYAGKTDDYTCIIYVYFKFWIALLIFFFLPFKLGIAYFFYIFFIFSGMLIQSDGRIFLAYFKIVFLIFDKDLSFTFQLV